MSDAQESQEEPSAIRYRERIPLDRPWLWLEAGWRDFVRVPATGLVYGAGLVLASWLVVFLVLIGGQIHLLLPLTGGFFIVAPVLVAGLYDTSRRLERGAPATLWTALFGWRAPGQLAMIGIVLLLIHLLWIRVAMFLYPLFLLGQTPGWDNLVATLSGATAGLAVGTAIGGALALLAFAATAISVPMLIDREVSVIEAVIASLTVVQDNPRVMLLWAAIIVVGTAIGVATLFVGLVVVGPVLAHATWHAYRDISKMGAIR